MNKVLKITALVLIIAGLVFVGYKLFEKKEKDETEIIKAEEKKDDKKADDKKEEK